MAKEWEKHMIRTMALLSAMALAMPALAADQSAEADSAGTGRLSGFWGEVFPLPGESYGMFADPYGSPHDSETITSAWKEVESGEATQTAGAEEATPPRTDEQIAATHEVDPLVEGPDLRDGSGRTD